LNDLVGLQVPTWYPRVLISCARAKLAYRAETIVSEESAATWSPQLLVLLVDQRTRTLARY